MSSKFNRFGLYRSMRDVRLIFKAVVVFLFVFSTPPALAKPVDIESQVKGILKRMTLEQKVGQMVQGEIKWVTPQDVSEYYLGSVLNGGGSFPNGRKDSSVDDWLNLADSYYRASMDTGYGGAGIPIIWGTDAVHGHNNVVGATLFPHNIGLGAANDPGLMEKIGEITAREVAVTGIDWIFAPTVAVAKDFRWGRTYESYSAEPSIVRSYAGSVIRGMQGAIEELAANTQKTVATAKHFIGDGGTFRGIDQGDTRLELEQLLERHGQGYISALDAGVQTVMASFNSWNGLKVHGHKQLLTEILKNQMGFDGFVISDWNGIGQVKGCNNASCPQAINAGIDMMMAPEDWKELIANTVKQVKTGEIPMARINDAVSRILRVKLRAGLFEKGAPSTRVVSGNAKLIGASAHRSVAREAVRKSLVLLKNQGQILPLKPNQHILVAGDGADNIGKQNGGWSITWQGTENKNDEFPGATSIYVGIHKAVKDIGGSVELSPDGSWSEKPDVAVVVFGEEPYAEGVGDVESLVYRDGLKTDLQLLKKLSKQQIPVVSVFLTGRPLWVNAELNSSDAFVVAWLPGTEGAGVADVIVSDKQGRPRYDFTGRLSFPWPNVENNGANKADPVADSLFIIGQGLSYGAKELITQKLNEDPLQDSSSQAQVIFSGSNRPPWKAYLGDSSDWSQLVTGTSAISAFGGLHLSVVDGEVQQDSRQLEWSDGRESQFFWQAEEAIDLTALADNGGAIMMTYRVDKRPKGRVVQRMDCGWPCHGNQDMTEWFHTIPQGEWVQSGISLQCYKKAGVDLKKVNTPWVLTTAKSFAITIRDVRILPNAPVDLLLSCS